MAVLNYPGTSEAWAIILAAGSSTRMGQCKATLPWQSGLSLLAYQIQQWRQAGFSTLTVLGAHNAKRLNPLTAGTQTVVNADLEKGKSGSVLVGLQALPSEFSVIAISAVDQPRSATTYRQLLAQHQAGITVPAYLGKWGHPILFSPSLLPDLLRIQDATQGIRQVLKTHSASIQVVEMESSEVLLDLNTPEQFNAATRAIPV